MGCWSEVEKVSSHRGQLADWQAEAQSDDFSIFDVFYRGVLQGRVTWSHTGAHNISNALVTLAAAHHIGVQPKDGITALCQFRGVKRRMELLATVAGIAVYDDFAHHPTAIATTLEGLRGRVNSGRIVALIEPRSNTMRMGVYKDRLAPATACADEVIWYQPPGLDWSLDSVIADSHVPARLSTDLDSSVRELVTSLKEGDHLVIMSNGGFGGVHQRVIKALRARWEQAE
jgi:UDP-N-acetylmuramate: L-alanyl-gamma-D-glutamyl-meso-diaminopimelate ligase